LNLPSPGEVVDTLGDGLEIGGEVVAGACHGATGGLCTEGLEEFRVHPDQNSPGFKAGDIGGTVVAVGSGYGLAAKVAGRAGLAGVRKLAIGGVGGTSTEITLDATRATVNGEPYGPLDALRALVSNAAGGALNAALRRCAGSIFGGALGAADTPFEPAAKILVRNGKIVKPTSPQTQARMGDPKQARLNDASIVNRARKRGDSTQGKTAKEMVEEAFGTLGDLDF
jgi:hypothetical protein